MSPQAKWLYINRVNKWAQSPRYLFPRATKERGGTMVEGLGPLWTRLIHNFPTLVDFPGRKGQKSMHVWISRHFYIFVTPNKAGKFSGTIFCQTGKTIENSFSDPRNEITWIRSKQARFPRKKRVRVPNKGRGSDLDRSADLVSPVNDFHFRN